MTELRGGGSLLATDGMAVRQVALHCQLPPGALPSPPILYPNSYFTLEEGELGGVGGGSLGWWGYGEGGESTTSSLDQR